MQLNVGLRRLRLAGMPVFRMKSARRQAPALHSLPDLSSLLVSTLLMDRYGLEFFSISQCLLQNFTRFWNINPMLKKSLLPVLLVPSCILLIPLAAMLFKADGWAWDAADFIIFWVLIAGVMLAYKLVASKAANRAYRVATGVGLATGLILIWINGAVGLIGSEDNPANLMYAGVLAVGTIGAIIARLEPLGMARALFATALAQFLVPVVALIIWRADFSPGVGPVFGLNFFFVLMFAVSALLFWNAAIKSGEAGEQRTA
jgi:hypothetical protein